MSVFDPIELRWKGDQFEIPARRVLASIASVEEILPFGVIAQMANGVNINVSKISQAYGCLLRLAGVKATDEDVYELIIENPDEAGGAREIIWILMTSMLPRKMKERVTKLAQQAEEGNTRPTQVSASSKQRGNSRSVPAK